MAIVDILGFCISVFGVVIYLRFLLPCNIIPVISTMLTDAEQSLALALTIGASSELSNYRVDLAMFARQLALIRIESHHSPRLAPQIWLAVRRAYRLYSLASQIAVIRREVQMAMDLSLLGTPQTQSIVTSPQSQAPPPPITTNPTPPPPVPMN